MGFSDNGPIRFKVLHSPLPSMTDKRALIEPAFDPIEQLTVAALCKSLGIPASMFEYRCPFDFISEFDKWFEFHRRLYFNKESSHSVIRSMLYAEAECEQRMMSDYIIADCNYSSARLEYESMSARVIKGVADAT